MAGIFGDEINNRAEFFRVLDQAKNMVTALLRRRKADETLNSVNVQLDAIAQWTANARTPTIEERSKIGMGIRMIREFSEERDPELQALSRAAGVLNTYFRYWPDDTTASNPNNEHLAFQVDAIDLMRLR